MISKKGRVLGVDFGKNTIGLAITDEDQQMVFGRGTVSLKKGLQRAFQFLMNLCEQEKVVSLVCGLPLSLEGEDTPQTLKIRNFAERLQDFLKNNSLDLPLFFQDESFTSFNAQTELLQLGVSSKKHKENEDELAAVLILKRWLEKKG